MTAVSTTCALSPSVILVIDLIGQLGHDVIGRLSVKP